MTEEERLKHWNDYINATDFDVAMTAFHKYLASQQQPLGEEFEKVLHDNLWELYTK